MVGLRTIPFAAALVVTLFATGSARAQGSCNYSVDRDAWLEQGAPNERHGSDTELSTKNKAGDNMRSLFGYDLSGLASEARVSSATAWFYVSRKDDSGDPVNVHRVTKNWNENSAKWNNRSGDFDPAIESSFEPTSEGWISVDLTDLVQSWVCGTTNHGLMLIATSDDYESKYASREWSPSSQRPCLEVAVGVGNGCGAAVGHFEISHAGSASTCTAENITIAHHDGAHGVDTGYTGTITLSTSTGNGDWSLVAGSGSLINSGSGSATYTYVTGDGGSVVLGLLDANSETLSIDATDGTDSEDPSEDPSLAFSAPGGTNTVRDELASISYAGDDGSQSWSSGWQELGESTNANSGLVRVKTSNTYCASFRCIRIGGDQVDIDNLGLLREADLSGAVSATLTFSRRRQRLDGSGGSITLAVSANGGSSWSDLQTYSLNGTDSGQVVESFDISAYIASNTQIRFLGSGSDVESYFYADDIQIEYSSGGCPTSGHLAISHDGTAVNCQAENVTITAHDDAHSVLTSYSGTVDLSTSTAHGDWSLVSGAGAFGNAGSGVASYTFVPADSGTVVLGLRNPSVETLGIDAVAGSIGEDFAEDPSLVFSESGFVFLANGAQNAIGTQIGGKASITAPGAQTLELQAIRTSDSTGACEAALTGANTVEIGFECENPASCTTRQVALGGVDLVGNPNGSVASYTGVSLDFGDATDSTAAFAFSYPDTGQIQLHARITLPSSGVTISGASNSFVVRPFAFDVVATGNPGATGAGGTAFTTAGSNFQVNAEAVLWSAADDLDFDGIADGHADTNPGNNATLSDNAAALNYGREASTEDVRLAAALVAPSPGYDPGLGGGTSITSFGAGSGSSTTAYYDEVGIVELTASVSDSDFLGIGAAATNAIRGRSGYVGRFTPFDFDVSYNAPSFDETCLIGGFTYVGQSFQFGTPPVITVTAKSARGTTTLNYTGAWWKLDNASLANRSYTASPAGLDISGLPPVASDPAIAETGGGTGTLTFGTGSGLAFARSAPQAPFDAEISLSIDVLDGDGVAFSGNPAAFGAASSGNGIDFAVDKEMRYGRLVLGNAHDSELVTLPMPLHAQYFNGFVFVSHTDDACSDIPASALSLVKSPAGMPTTPTIGNRPLLSGEAGLRLSAPGSGNSGTIDIVVDLSDATGAGMPWLQYDWPSDGNADGVPDDNPVGRATFGIYRGNDRLIYLREVY